MTIVGITIKDMICPYCGGGVKLADRSIIVNKDNSLGSGKIYVCEKYPSCDSYVGCNSSTDIPLGTLANTELRRLRMRAHKEFDWMWKSNRKSRHEAYKIMQKVMALSEEKAHIGVMNAEQCQQVIEIFGEFKAQTVSYKIPKAV